MHSVFLNTSHHSQREPHFAIPLAIGRPTKAPPVTTRPARIAPAWITTTAFEVALKVDPQRSSTLMNKKVTIEPIQPEPFTPGLTKRMVYDHALKIYQATVADDWPLSREDWVLAEQDLLEKIRNRNS
jgi:hypothetical protein